MSSTRNYFKEEPKIEHFVEDSDNKFWKPEELKHAIKLEWKYGEKSFQRKLLTEVRDYYSSKPEFSALYEHINWTNMHFLEVIETVMCYWVTLGCTMHELFLAY